MAKPNIQRYVLPQDLANEIKQSKCKLAIVVEGHTDVPFFRKMTIKEQCSLFSAAGKENLLTTIEDLNQTGYERPYLGVVDKDFDAIDSAPEPPTYPNNVFPTDCHDRELMCFVPHVREDFYNEYFAAKNKKSYEWLLDHIVADARVLGYFQLANHKESWNMTTKKGDNEYMDYGKFYDGQFNMLPYEQLAVKINSNHRVPDFIANNVAGKMREVQASAPADCELLNGHQIALILIEYMGKFGEKRATYKEEDVGRDIRMAYSVDDFHSTSLYSALHEYELAIEHQFLK